MHYNFSRILCSEELKTKRNIKVDGNEVGFIDVQEDFFRPKLRNGSVDQQPANSDPPMRRIHPDPGNIETVIPDDRLNTISSREKTLPKH